MLRGENEQLRRRLQQLEQQLADSVHERDVLLRQRAVDAEVIAGLKQLLQAQAAIATRGDRDGGHATGLGLGFAQRKRERSWESSANALGLDGGDVDGATPLDVEGGMALDLEVDADDADVDVYDTALFAEPLSTSVQLHGKEESFFVDDLFGAMLRRPASTTTARVPAVSVYG
jgi:hypothetical protein